ncbi:MAG: DUF4249 domain-containing protein [Saprospiraceae bacterium]
MKFRISFLIIFSFLFFTSCQDVIELEVPDGEVLLVVDGWLTDQEGEKQVLISTTANYFDNSISPKVENAMVVLFDENGVIDTLIESNSGRYITNYEGVVGKTYHIYIRTTSGEEYESNPEMLKFVSAIANVQAEFREETAFEDEGYYVSIDTEEPLGVGDFYRWKQYVNDTLLNEPFDLLYASDEFVDGNPIIGFDVTTKPLSLGDSYRVQQLSISREAFDFFTQLQTQTAFVGSLFDSPPAALEGNMVSVNSTDKKVLGYFGVSAVSEIGMVIE